MFAVYPKLPFFKKLIKIRYKTVFKNYKPTLYDEINLMDHLL